MLSKCGFFPQVKHVFTHSTLGVDISISLSTTSNVCSCSNSQVTHVRSCFWQQRHWENPALLQEGQPEESAGKQPPEAAAAAMQTIIS